MMVFKRKQIVVLSLVLMIIIAGYLQYSYKKSSSSADNESEKGRLGEAVYVDNFGESSNTGADAGEKASKDISASKEASNFFAQAKLDKEVARSRDVDMLKEISSGETATHEAKSQAYEQMMKLVDNSQREMSIETLLKEAGFEDVFALFAEDGSLDIVVKAPSLTGAQTAQIADIAMRHADMDMKDIHIRNVY
jgi:stage III sporulation protein AH